MGGTKIQTESGQTSTATPTAEETAMQKIQLKQYTELEPYQTQAQKYGFGLINQLLTGGKLPGYFEGMPQGISADAMAKQSSELVRQAMPAYQTQGLTDSGVMQKGIVRDIANQLVYPTEQFNLGTKLNMLNLASGQAAQVQGTTQQQANTLSQSLAGLRSLTGSGWGAQRNPFTGLSLGILGRWGGSNAGQ